MPLRSLFILLAFSLLSVCVHAQGNLSFEQTDSSGALAEWNVSSGTATRRSALFFGGTPFTPTHESYFLMLENDTISSPVRAGMMTTSFAYTDTPHSIFFDALYIPAFTHQRYEVTVMLSKWQSNKRDTLMYKSNLADAVADSLNRIQVKWTKRQFDLGVYANAQLPDSATITIRNDAVSPIANSTALLLDHINFGKWKVGIREQDLQRGNVLVYPNPASSSATIRFDLREPAQVRIGVYDRLGKLVMTIAEEQAVAGANSFNADLDEIPAGLYFIRIEKDRETVQLKLVVTK